MPIHIENSCKQAIGELAQNCNCRSLLKDRYVFIDEQLDEAKFIQASRICTAGHHIITNLIESWGRAAAAERNPAKQGQIENKITRCSPFTNAENPESIVIKHPHAWLPGNASKVRARLISRMMVNMGEGVMENANLHLNRFGIPTIPGSAIKGCARRMALQALHDWVDHINDPDESLPAEARLRPHPDDLCAPCCESFTSPADMLAAIARVFGWVQSDWEGDASDLRWAVHNEPEIISAAKEQIRAAAQFAGTVAFIEAQPKSDPGIELDVLTPHHTKYHNGEQGYDDAPDTEDPVPVYFPAVRPQSAPNHYIFPILPLPRLKEGDLASAEIWLLHGLELFGIGAKTAAGYGCYEAYEPPEDLGDYENEDTFKNRVLDRLSKSGEYPQLKKEIEIIKGNPKNARWIPILRERARADNNTKKRLKKTDWFPKEWISSETTP